VSAPADARGAPAAARHGPLPPLLLALTVVTGVVDAVSILRLGRVFVANMTGNVVFTGFALVGAPGFSLSASLAALAGFLVGALGGGSLTKRPGGVRAPAGDTRKPSSVCRAVPVRSEPPGRPAWSRNPFRSLFRTDLGACCYTPDLRFATRWPGGRCD